MLYQITDKIIPNKELTYNVSAPDNCGRIIIQLDRTLLGYEIRELPAVVIRCMSEFEGKLLQIENQAYVWDKHEDYSFNVLDVPNNFTIVIQPIIDIGYIKTSKINPSESFPISVSFDNSDISTENNSTSSGGGGSEDDPSTGSGNINTISIAGVELQIDSRKNVDIPIATDTTYGVIKGSNLENGIKINSSGQLELNQISLDKVNQSKESALIIDCGNSINI